MPRFVISLTTLPDRLPHIKPVIKSIIDKNPGIDKLYICLPYGDVDEELIPNDTDIIKVIRCKDYGPITKILGCLPYENDPDTLILTLDDDTIITQNLSKIFKKKSLRYPDSALSMSGWCHGSFPSYFQLVIDNDKDIYVDWIQGVHGILYKRKFLDLDEVLEFDKDVKVLFKNDDHRISAYLETKNINRLVINRNPRNYFKNYCKVSGIDPISGGSIYKSVKFWKDVYDISSRYKKKGIYYRNYSKSKSVVFIVIFLLILLIGLFILISYNCNFDSYLYSIGLLILLIIIFLLLINYLFFSMMLEKEK